MLNKNSARFGVFRDIPKASDIKIHSSECTFFKIHDPNAPTTDWHYTDNLKSATEIASKLARENNMRYRDCKVCKPSMP